MSDETDRPSDDAAKKATDPNAPPGWERNAEVASPEEDEAIAADEREEPFSFSGRARVTRPAPAAGGGGASCGHVEQPTRW